MTMIAPWLRKWPKEKEIVFKDKDGNELKLVAVPDGDEVDIFFEDEIVTRQVVHQLGKDWFRDVSSEVL